MIFVALVLAFTGHWGLAAIAFMFWWTNLWCSNE